MTNQWEMVQQRLDFLENKIELFERYHPDLSNIELSEPYSNMQIDSPKESKSKLDVFDAISMRLENSISPARLRYLLPRNVGTTTFLINLTKRLLEQNYTVLHVVDNYTTAVGMNLYFCTNFVTAKDAYHSGYNYDYIICDNCSSELIPNKVYLEIQSVDY